MAPIRRRRAQGQTEFTLDTVLGTEEIGNDIRAVTPRYLLSKISNLREANRILMDRSTKRGVVFGRWAWSDEQELARDIAAEHPSGDALAGIVDSVSIFAHATMGEYTSEFWLQQVQRAHSAGFESKLESEFMNSFTRRFPAVFVDGTKEVYAGSTLAFIKTLEKWRGVGACDGRREQILSALRLAREHVDTYNRDKFKVGSWLLELALATAVQTERFISMLFNHLEDGITKLMSLGIPEDKVMMLASEQVIHIYEFLFEPRQHAM